MNEMISTTAGTTLLETELDCAECLAIVVDIYEVHGVSDGRGYISCYECGEPAEVEIE
jgi:transcription elongation factor Elf1